MVRLTLTNNGKQYIANNFGINNCFVASGLSWTAVDINGVTASESGGTAQIVARLLTPIVYKEIQITNPAAQVGTFTNTQLISANDNQSITVPEVSSEIAKKDGSPAGEEQFCTNVVCVPLWHCSPELNGTEIDGCGNTRTNEACVPKPPGMAGVYEFIGPPDGVPSVTLDLSELVMQQDPVDYHFEMNGIKLINTSDRKFYATLEVRLFAGALSECPQTGTKFVGMDRVSTTRNVRIKVLDLNETETVNADFYQPSTLIGVHTVCLLVHGAWQRDDLELEIAGIPG